ncbi:unnamed protein product [Pylaiella littoralis]
MVAVEDQKLRKIDRFQKSSSTAVLSPTAVLDATYPNLQNYGSTAVAHVNSYLGRTAVQKIDADGGECSCVKRLASVRIAEFFRDPAEFLCQMLRTSITKPQ